MDSSENAMWVEYLLRRKFGSRWLLTHLTQHASNSRDGHMQLAKEGIETEADVYSRELGALADNELQRRYLEERVVEIEPQLRAARTEAKRLQRENAELGKIIQAASTDKPLDPREKASMLRIIGALIHDYNGLVEDYNSTEKATKHRASRKQPLDVGDAGKAAKAISAMAQEMPQARTIAKIVEQAISIAVAPRKQNSPSKS